MPHITVEYSANLDAELNMTALCGDIKQTLLASGLFELGAVRVRAFKAEAYAITDDHPANAFADVSVRIGAGRSDVEKKRLGEALFAMLTERFGALLGQPHFALSLEIREIDPELSWKKNSMHARLRGK
jgi:5-carboxymethyl-2-hydroxymuconate isomerase